MVELCALGLAAVLLVALTRYHWQHVSDDAFIAFRYVRNLLAGHGPVWNPGEAVEGYSSPLWLGLLALGAAAGLPLPAWAGALGIAFLLLTLLLVHRITWAAGRSRVAAALACLATALVAPLHDWATAGLETSLFVALITAGVAALVVAAPGRWAVVAALLGVARPEGPFLVVALAGLALLAHGRAALAPGRVVLALAPALGWMLWRRWFYRDWWPNPYYAKATGELWSRVEAGLLYAMAAVMVWLATVATVWLSGAWRRATAAALALVGGVLALVVVEGGDWMWHARLVVPAVPALVALTAAALAHTHSRRAWAASIACALVGSSFAPKPASLLDALAGGRMPSSSFQEGTLAQASFEAARFIAGHYPKDALVAVNHAGALPFALPNPALDMTGLCDWHIAHERTGGVHHKFDAAYVLARKPALVVLNSATRPGSDGVWYHPGYWEGETALTLAPGWAERYRPVDAFWEWHWVGDAARYVLLYERVAE